MVLIIDDDDDLRDSLRDLLQRRGYRVETAEHGQAALAVLAARGVPCVVLLDLAMPVMDGWQFLSAVQADAALATIPIVIASAHGATHAPAGVAGVLRKPFDLDRLLQVVARHCGPPPPA
jgi:CheY-like chemotaxis protein